MSGILPLADACQIVREARTSSVNKEGENVTGPLMQYWDANAPDEVQRLLDRNKSYCLNNDIPYRFFDDTAASDFLSGIGGDFLAAYTVSPHPAVKSDIFRLCYIAEHGGYYLDADMAVRDNFADVFMHSANGLVLQWDSHERVNCPNWFFGFPAGSAICRALAEETAASILHASRRGPNAILRNVLEISGPGIFTRVVGTFLRDHPVIEHPSFLTAMGGYTYVQNGPEYLGSLLAYKATDRHWLVASKNLSQ